MRRLARSLADAGHLVTCYGVLADGAEPEEDDGPVVLVRTALERFERPQPGIGGLLSSRRAWRRLDGLVGVAMARNAPEAVLAHGVEAAAAAWRAAGRAGLPFFYDEARPGVIADGADGVDGADGAGAASGATAEAVRAMERRASAALDEVLSAPLAGCLVASEALAEAFLRRMPRGAPRPVVVRDLPPHRDIPRSDALRRRLGVWPTDRVLLYHAPLRDDFGLVTSIRSLVHLGEGAVLAIVGGAWCQDRITAVAESSGLAGRVKPLPKPSGDDLVRWLGSADAALFALDPASPDAARLLPSEAVECVQAGTPLVATEPTETGRLVRAHGLGATSPVAEPESFAAAVRTVLAATAPSAGDGAALGPALRRFGRDALCWEHECARLVGAVARGAAGREGT